MIVFKENKNLPSIYLREATKEDAEILFKWVNKEDSLSNKLNTNEAVTFANHLKWFANKIVDSNCAIWIIVAQEEPVGQLRLEVREKNVEVDIYVTSKARGLGAAKKALNVAAEKAKQIWSSPTLIARIKNNNFVSRRLFKSAGYSELSNELDHIVMVLDCSLESTS